MKRVLFRFFSIFIFIFWSVGDSQVSRYKRNVSVKRNRKKLRYCPLMESILEKSTCSETCPNCWQWMTTTVVYVTLFTLSVGSSDVRTFFPGKSCFVTESMFCPLSQKSYSGFIPIHSPRKRVCFQWPVYAGFVIVYVLFFLLDTSSRLKTCWNWARSSF